MRIYIMSKRELADAIYGFATRTGKLGSVETVFSLYSGEETRKEKFYGQPKECILGALKLLEMDRKAEIFSSGDDDPSAGVKFFK